MITQFDELNEGGGPSTTPPDEARSGSETAETSPDSAEAREQPRPTGEAESSGMSNQRDLLRGVVGSTSQIVQQAATILEEEIAAGIVAAKRVEKRLVDVGKLRSGKSEEVMQRFRRDAHEVVDILVDLVNLATNSVSDLTQRVITIRGGESAAHERSDTSGRFRSGAVPVLIASQVIKPGQSLEIPITLENESENTTESFHFLCSDLLNSSGERIVAQQINFIPASLMIGPKHSATVIVTVAVPEGTPIGVYSGLIQAAKLEQLRAVLTVEIK